MSHSDIIIIVVTLTISSTLGVYAAIRVVNQYTRPPVNTLIRSGDIELVDFIEPMRPQEIYNYPDLLVQQFPIYGRIPSGVPPSYRTVDGYYINSCLENSFNSDIILWLISSFILVLFIREMIISYYFSK